MYPVNLSGHHRLSVNLVLRIRPTGPGKPYTEVYRDVTWDTGKERLRLAQDRIVVPTKLCTLKLEA